MGRILGHTDELSVAPGDTIRFMVSCEDVGSTFRADIVRLVCGDDDPSGAGLKTEICDVAANGDYPARRQSTWAGSHAIVADHTIFHSLSSFSVAAMIWPTTPAQGRQGLVTRWCEQEQEGFGLFIDEQGATAFLKGDGDGAVDRISTGTPLLTREWYLVAATYDEDTGEACVYQEPLVRYPGIADRAVARGQMRSHRIAGTGLPLVFAARTEMTDETGPRIGGHCNGKIASPRLYGRAVSSDEVGSLKQGLDRLDADAVVGAWDFSLDIASMRITDTSENKLHGSIVNLPARGVTGWNWSGEVQSWRDAPDQYGAIHFHDDDLYDAAWKPDFALTIPESMTSGTYAAHVRAGEAEDFRPFFVRPERGSKKSPIAYLAPTASYIAYANSHWLDEANLNEMKRGMVETVNEADLYLNEHRELGVSTYDTHADGSGVFYSSRLRPILDMRPKTGLWNFNADTHITDWLEVKGYAYDVITDEDLHREGFEILADYRVLVTGTHPEYTSAPMLSALETFTQSGGPLMYLGGNGFYWRIAFHPEVPDAIEVRKFEGSRSWDAMGGERFHSFDGAYGGIWRSQGRAPQRLVGVGFCIETSRDRSGYFRRTKASSDPRAAFIVDGVSADEPIGDFGVLGGAAGIECDRHDRVLGSPPNSLVVATSEGLSRYAMLVPEEVIFTHTAMSAEETDQARADMVFFETTEGGAVFSTGSISWSSCLNYDDYDNNVSRITANVLDRFLDPRPFPDENGET